MERPIAHRGAVLVVAFAVTRNGASPGLEFYESCSDRNKGRLLKLFKLLGDRGWINNDQKFKPIEGTKFCEFKDFQLRMPCFRTENTMVITHGFVKKQGPIPPAEIIRAERIRGEDALMMGEKHGKAKRVH
jgi:hypothetical protein